MSATSSLAQRPAAWASPTGTRCWPRWGSLCPCGTQYAGSKQTLAFRRPNSSPVLSPHKPYAVEAPGPMSSQVSQSSQTLGLQKPKGLTCSKPLLVLSIHMPWVFTSPGSLQSQSPHKPSQVLSHFKPPILQTSNDLKCFQCFFKQTILIPLLHSVTWLGAVALRVYFFEGYYEIVIGQQKTNSNT